MKTEDITVVTTDDVELYGTLLIPENPKAVVQFNCGTGVNKAVYLSFLTYLSEHGFLCCLWNYRGCDQKVPVDLAHCDYQFSDYGIKDMPAVKSYLQNRFPELPFFMLAHSAGGQQIGFMDNLDDIKGVINFAVSGGYFKNMPLKYRLKAYTYFYLVSSVSVLLTGYVNGEKLGLMENLPKGVVYEWRDWLTKEDYLFDPAFYGKTVPIGHFQKYTFPIRLFWTEDDTISNEKNTHAYWKHVKSEKPITMTKLTPKNLGLKKIDHFGFFKRHMKDKIWPDVVAQLNQWLESE